MRKITIILLTIIILTGCGNNQNKNIDNNKINNSEKEQEQVQEEQENLEQYEDNTMTLDQYNLYVNDLINYSKKIGNFSSQFDELVDMYAEKYNNSKMFDWSEYSRFNRLQKKVSDTYQEILNYELNGMSNDMRKCFYKLQYIAKITNDYYNSISTKLSKDTINSYTSNYASTYKEELEELTYLQKVATISFLEKIGADQQTIDEMKKELNN